MRPTLDDKRPIFQQIREMIEDEIVDGRLLEESQAPSTNQLVAYYKINPATVLKGLNELVDAGILYKKRGVGMFVAKGAKATLLNERKQVFQEDYVARMLQEANRLGLSVEDVQQMIDSMKKRGDAK
ncbi:GntR family transcriptional regulator [Geomicrobium sp. JCM 19039]|uniref:GntR family transcriptional regulator n=1 Tax=Geomicrobium sp. JCM 19039 TaxID=1460636 RepID=UPI00045F4B35|nr:GntR family transcriptional regulator [Geomicrobium sp. JCM 19039]GAK14329.1 transcriptional regulator, GntR family [Geomicrobium sp. JCM 19039]